MMNESVEGVPWLEKDEGTTITATVLEGAEVVRTAAVSYATPILHQVFIQGGTPVSSGASIKSTCDKSYRINMTPKSNGITCMSDCTERSLKENSSLNLPSYVVSSDSSLSQSSSNSSSPSSSSVWVFSPTLLSSNSMVLRPVTTSSRSSTFSCQSSSPISSLASTSTSSVSSSPSSFSSTSVTKNDDELTSLSWLQNSDLLLGTALSPIKPYTAPKSNEISITDKKRNSKTGGRKDHSSSAIKADEGHEGITKPSDKIKHETQEEYKIESPTSDYTEEATELLPIEAPESGESCLGRTSTPKPQAIIYNPKVHLKAKPPFSFSCLIFMAIEESPTKALPVKDIYAWILEHYPYFRTAPTGWKNSVRHNLSLNKCFSKVEKAQNLGKGSLWMVDQTYRPNLLQAMNKTPFTTQSKNDRTFLMSNKAVINTKYLYGLTGKNNEKSIAMEDFVVENEVDVLPSSRVNATELSSTESSDLLTNQIETSDNIGSDKINQSLEKLPEEIEIKNLHVEEAKVKPILYSPDPELFPRLAKRLGSHRMEPFSINFQSEDVDAAAAMLVLKHGPRMLSPYHETFSRMMKSEGVPDAVGYNLMKRSHKNSESSDSGSVLISSSPSLDHAYVSDNKTTSQEHIFRGKKQTISPTSSVDEAFFDDSYESESFGEPPIQFWQEGPRPYEEADALLNLASVATSLASRERLLIPEPVVDEAPVFLTHLNSLSKRETLAYQCTESQQQQPLYSETHANEVDDADILTNKPLTKSKLQGLNNQKSVKRKQSSTMKLPTAKKLRNFNSTIHLDNKNLPKSSISESIYLNNNNNNSNYNNNNNCRISNKNKVKVRKLLKSDKLKY